MNDENIKVYNDSNQIACVKININSKVYLISNIFLFENLIYNKIEMIFGEICKKYINISFVYFVFSENIKGEKLWTG